MRVTRFVGLVSVAALLVSLAASPGAVAAPGAIPMASTEKVSKARTAIVVTPTSALRITETITYDFGTQLKHGIFRDFPLRAVIDGRSRNLRIAIDDVSVDGGPAKFTVSRDSALHLRIGDPDKTITGAHTYVIKYTVRGALIPVGSSGRVELYWDLVGTGWSVPIESASAIVTTPSDIVSAKCFVGPQGSTATCPVKVSGDRAAYGPVELEPEEGLTADIVFAASQTT